MNEPLLDGVRPSWIAFGWFISAAVTAVIIFAFLVLGVFGLFRIDGPDEFIWFAVSIAVGFGVGGYFAGWRAGVHPFLHGIGIGLFSIVVWILANLLSALVFGGWDWDAISLVATIFLLALQIVFASLGAWAGANWAHTPPALRAERGSGKGG